MRVPGVLVYGFVFGFVDQLSCQIRFGIDRRCGAT